MQIASRPAFRGQSGVCNAATWCSECSAPCCVVSASVAEAAAANTQARHREPAHSPVPRLPFRSHKHHRQAGWQSVTRAGCRLCIVLPSEELWKASPLDRKSVSCSRVLEAGCPQRDTRMRACSFQGPLRRHVDIRTTWRCRWRVAGELTVPTFDPTEEDRQWSQRFRS